MLLTLAMSIYPVTPRIIVLGGFNSENSRKKIRLKVGEEKVLFIHALLAGFIFRECEVFLVEIYINFGIL